LHRLGIKRGAYHYFRAYGCGYEQAHNYLSNVSFQPGDIVPVLDLEHTYGVAPEIMLEEASIWLNIVEQRLGVKPIIYTYHSFYEQHLASGIFDRYPLWIARYAEDSPLLSSGKVWDIWQFSNKGRINGINTHVDLNILPGSFAALENICWYPERKIVEPLSTQNQVITSPVP
jgi:lysozyme